jgi:hypothetical protein
MSAWLLGRIRAPATPHESHPCFLVGKVYNGKPASPLNRRIIHVNLDDGRIETRDIVAVRDGKGKLVNVQLLGRVTVAVSDHLGLVQGWIKEIIRAVEKGISTEIIVEGIKARIAGMSPTDIKDPTTTLDVFTGTIVNRTKDMVFGPHREPSSLL